MIEILVVDDDAQVRQMVASMLRALGHSVVTASNGEEAVNIFRGARLRINLILTDLRMPVMDGHELVRRILAMQSTATIICMSAYTESQCPPGTVFMAKPFTMETVRDCITRALGTSGIPTNANARIAT
ncbi:MAG: two-component system response regulator [Terriglobia bacterium]|nr:MAG: two-component system response regulator [Terriglobia bacterium]